MRFNYDYHFTVKELANEFKEQFECLGKNKEKYKTFSVPTKKETTKIDKDGNESIETISYKIKFIGRLRFIGISLSKLVDNPTEGIHKIRCKDCGCFLEYGSVKNNLVKYKCLSCHKDYSNKSDEELKKKFKNTFKFLTMTLKKLFCR